MQLLHRLSKTRAQFDEPNLVSCAGLVPVMRLAERCGLSKLIDECVHIASSARPVAKGNPGVNPQVKIPAIVAGMVAGADSIDDLDVIRHGGMDKLFGGTYAPSSLGSHLRAFDQGNVAQLEKAARQLLVALAAHTPLLPDVGSVCYVDIDDFRRRVYGHKKQGAKFGPVKVGGYLAKLRNLDPLIASISTPTAAPVVAATRLRGGNAASGRGADSFVREVLGVTRQVINAAARPVGAGCGQPGEPKPGLVLVRLDSGFYNHKAVNAVIEQGACFSVTARTDTAIQATIAGIGDNPEAWTPIKYPQAIWERVQDFLCK
jgi:hypothetical protein